MSADSEGEDYGSHSRKCKKIFNQWRARTILQWPLLVVLKKEVAFEDALRIIYLIDPSDKVNHERVKYIYKHKGRLAGISNLKHLLEGQGLSNTEVVAAKFQDCLHLLTSFIRIKIVQMTA